MAGFTSHSNPQVAMTEFQKFMGQIAEEREKKMDEFASRLNEERANRQAVQEEVAFAIARVSPSACVLARRPGARRHVIGPAGSLPGGRAELPGDLCEVRPGEDGRQSGRRDGVPHDRGGR